IQIGFILAISLRLFVSYYVLGIQVYYPKLILVNSLVAFSMVFSVTPGNIGIKESIIGLSSSLLGISPDQALLGAVLDRIIAIIVVFGLGVVFSKLLLKKVEI
ncbi:MAG: lysylphosphatidylglycerol synthase domain-containing protein, partial [Candidatus Woesearchaeota archaeon]